MSNKSMDKNKLFGEKNFLRGLACELHEKKLAEKCKKKKFFFVFLISVLLTITTPNFVEIGQFLFFDP